MPVIPALSETKAGKSQTQDFETSLANKEAEEKELLESRRQRLQPAEITPLHSRLGDKSENFVSEKKFFGKSFYIKIFNMRLEKNCKIILDLWLLSLSCN